jgi:serine/threonine-protein kinase
MARFFLNLLVTLVCLSAALVAGWGAVTVWDLSAPKEVQVPSIVGKPVGEVRAMLARRRLRLEVLGEDPHSQLPENTVTWAQPPPGMTVKEGRAIRVRLSTGQKTVAVPPVTQMSVQRAQDVLLSFGLSWEKEKEVESDLPGGTVVAQTPSPGAKVPRGETVKLVVSKQEKVAIPKRVPPTSYVVRFAVPSDGRSHFVAIWVEDVYGGRPTHQAYYQPGQALEVPVDVHGRGRILVKMDDKVLKEVEL